MNINEEYYSKIIYQKNAIETLNGILKTDFSSKKVFFIASKTAYQKYGTAVVNEFNRAGCEFIFKFIDSGITQSDLDEIIKENTNCKVVVSLGGGTVNDSGKYVAKQLDLKHILIVSNPTTTAPFSNYCLLSDKNIVKKIDCDFAYKVIIDEGIIAKASAQSVKAGKEYILSFWEVLFNKQIANLLFEEKHSTSKLAMTLAKLKDSHFFGKENQALLVMDMLIDLGYCLKDIDLSFQTALSLALMLKNSSAIIASFGKLCLVSSNMLLSSYKKFFSLKKIETYSFLDFENLARSLKFLEIDAENVNLNPIKNIRSNRQLFLKLNAVKNQILALIDKCEEEISILENAKISTFYDMKKCLSVFGVLPFIWSCSPLTNVLSSSGLIVC